MTLALSYSPAPPVPTGEVPFDPNSAPSPVMGAYSDYVGETIHGEFQIGVSAVRQLTITADITIGQPNIITDANGVSTYTYSWSIELTEPGIEYHNIIATTDLYNPAEPDPNEINANTIVSQGCVKLNPTFFGCRRNN